MPKPAAGRAAVSAAGDERLVDVGEQVLGVLDAYLRAPAGRGQAQKVALAAAMRKLLRMLNAIAKHRTNRDMTLHRT